MDPRVHLFLLLLVYQQPAQEPFFRAFYTPCLFRSNASKRKLCSVVCCECVCVVLNRCEKYQYFSRYHKAYQCQYWTNDTWKPISLLSEALYMQDRYYPLQQQQHKQYQRRQHGTINVIVMFLYDVLWSHSDRIHSTLKPILFQCVHCMAHKKTVRNSWLISPN